MTVTLDELERTVQRERPDLSNTLAADGTVTIVFTDIVDSTVLTVRLGDHAWLDLLRRHNAVIEEATAAHGGTVVETQGDGSMLAFSSARRAVACARSIQREIASAFAEAPFPFASGSAFTQATHCTRPTISTARPCTTQRVSQAGLGGEVLVSNLVRDLVAEEDVEFVESREVELKGLEGSHRLYAVDLSGDG